MTDGDAKRQAAQAAGRQASASERQAEVAERRERRERSHVPFKDIASGVGSLIKGLKNHPQWYMNYPGGEYFGKLSFERPAGKASEHGMIWNGGIQTISYLPSLGSGKPLDRSFMPVYRALLRMQQEVRLANAGAKNYEPSDIAIYAIATGEVIAAYAELARIYSLINSKDPKNIWKRELAVRAISGIVYSEAAAQGQKILSTLRAAHSAMQTIAIPHIPYFDRVWHLAFNFFNDCKATRSNVIAFVRDAFGFLINSGYTTAQTSALIHFKPVERDDAPLPTTDRWAGDVDGRCTMLLDIIDALTNSTDYVTIMGDLAKAYGDTFDIPTIADDVEPCFMDDDVTLTQIDNTVLVGTPIWLQQNVNYAQYSVYDITDLDGNLVQGMLGQNQVIVPPLFRQLSNNVGLTGAAYHKLLNEAVPVDAPNDNPSPEDVYVLTRNITLLRPVTLGKAKQLIAHILPNGTAQTVNVPKVCYYKTDADLIACSEWDTDWDSGAIQTLYQTASFTPATDESDGPAFVGADVSGTEYFTAARFFQLTNTGTWNFSALYGSGMLSVDNSDYAVLFMRSYVGYHHAPILIVYDDGVSDNLASNVTPLYNAVEVSPDFIRSIHYAAVFSEFTVSNGGGRSQSRRRK